MNRLQKQPQRLVRNRTLTQILLAFHQTSLLGIVHRGKVVQWFDSGIDGEYVVKGNVGEVHVEVKDKKWHVREVDCPNQLCVKMGWADENSIIPITCLPNDVFIGSANLLSEYM